MQAHNITLTTSSNSTTNSALTKAAEKGLKLDVSSFNFPSFANVTNTTYDAPNAKRTRFSFKPEHLVVSCIFFNFNCTYIKELIINLFKKM